MIRCNASIHEQMIADLLVYKMNPSDFDYKRTGYRELIDIDWEGLYYRPSSETPIAGEGQEPVDMTSEEILMSNEVEEYSDELKRESDDQLRESIGKTTIAFMDLENMSLTSRMVALLLVLALLAAAARFLYNELAGEQRDLNDIRKDEIRTRKEKKVR